MKCFEWLVKTFKTSFLPGSVDPLQFAYRPNRSTSDTIAIALHIALFHLDQRNNYVRMLFIDYSSSFNTIVPSELVIELRDLRLNTALYDWILNFLTGTRQAVRIGSTTSTVTLNTSAPRGCVFSLLLFSLFTHDCMATNSSNNIVKFADSMTIIGLVIGNNEMAYGEEVRALTSLCQDSNNVSKTKELIVDNRKRQRDPQSESPKNTKRQYPPQQQSVHPICQAIQKYPLPHYQTAEQLLSSGCETPQLHLILHTPPKINYIELFFYVMVVLHITLP